MKRNISIFRVFAVSLLGALSAFCQADNFKHYGASQSFVILYEHKYSGVKFGLPGDKVSRSLKFGFENQSDEEVAEIDVQMTIQDPERLKIVYRSPVKTIRTFTSGFMPYTGGILPKHVVKLSDPIEFIVPSQVWQSGTVDEFKVVGVRTYKPGGDLHQLGHLYTKLWNASAPAAKKLFEKDPSLCRVTNKNHLTATHIAFATSELSVTDFVVKHGGSLADKTNNGLSILDFAPLNKHTGTLMSAAKLLGGVNHRNSAGQTPLHRAAMYSNAKAARWLIHENATIDIEDNEGMTPALEAILYETNDVLQQLVKAGANPRYVNKKGYGWMHIAMLSYGMPDILDVYKAPIDERNPKTGMTPLVYAVSVGRHTYEVWLIAHGADPNSKDAKGLSGYDYAKKTNTLGSDQFFRSNVERGLILRKSRKPDR